MVKADTIAWFGHSLFQLVAGLGFWMFPGDMIEGLTPQGMVTTQVFGLLNLLVAMLCVSVFVGDGVAEAKNNGLYSAMTGFHCGAGFLLYSSGIPMFLNIAIAHYVLACALIVARVLY